jgi:hypothetical protein
VSPAKLSKRNPTRLADARGTKMDAIDVKEVMEWEKICPHCGEKTKNRSRDGGLTSVFRCSECGEDYWIVPWGKFKDINLKQKVEG